MPNWINNFLDQFLPITLYIKTNWWVRRVYAILNYSEHFLILVSAITECVSISAFASLLGIPIGTASSAIGLKGCATVPGIKKYR